MAQLRAGGQGLRTAHARWGAEEGRAGDQRCALCLRDRGGATSPRETTTHFLGECPSLAGPRRKYVQKMQKAKRLKGDKEPTPRRVSIWLLRAEPGRADMVRWAAEFAHEAMAERRRAMAELGLY